VLEILVEYEVDWLYKIVKITGLVEVHPGESATIKRTHSKWSDLFYSTYDTNAFSYLLQARWVWAGI